MNVKSFFSFLTHFLSGFDIFISYRWIDAKPYAEALAAALRDKGFICFIDVKGMRKGDLITDALRRAIRKSTMFVLIVTENVPSSTWIKQEVETFSSLKRTIVPIDVDGAIGSLQLERTPWEILKDRDSIQESKNNIELGTPADLVLLEIERTFTAKRQEAVVARKVLQLALAVAAVVLVMIGIAMYQTIQAKYQQEKAQQMTRIAEEKTADAREQETRANAASAKAEESAERARIETGRATLAMKKVENEQSANGLTQTGLLLYSGGQSSSLRLETVFLDHSQKNRLEDYFRDQKAAQSLRAIETYEKALAYFKQADDILGEASIYQILGSTYKQLFDDVGGYVALRHLRPFRQEQSRYEPDPNLAKEYNPKMMLNLNRAVELYKEARRLGKTNPQEGNLHRIMGDLLEDEYSVSVIESSQRRKQPPDLTMRKQALNCYIRALPLYRQANNLAGQTYTLTKVCELLANFNETNKVAGYYLQMLQIVRKVKGTDFEKLMLQSVRGDDVYELDVEAFVLTQIGKAFSKLGKKERALEYYLQAPPLYDKYERGIFRQAYALRAVGDAYYDLRKTDQAIQSYIQALPRFAKRLNGRVSSSSVIGQDGPSPINWEMDSVRNCIKIAQLYYQSNKQREALEYLHKMLIPDPGSSLGSLTMLTLAEITDVYMLAARIQINLNEPMKAVETYDQLLEFLQGYSSRTKQVLTLQQQVLKRLGEMHETIGQKQKAEEYYRQSNEIKPH